MAEAPAGGPTRQELSNEDRLRAARREAPSAEAPPDAAAGPAAAPRRQSWLARQATTALAAGSLAFSPMASEPRPTPDRQGDVQPGAAGTDRAASAAARQQRLETQFNRSRRQEASRPSESVSNVKAAMSMAKATPATAIASTAAQALTGQLTTEDIQRGVGRGCILSLWNSLWLTYGHTIYPIAIIFYTAWASRYVRKYFPEVGEEWIPGPLLKKIPKPALIPIKLGELIGIAFILFWTLMIDLACIGLFALILAIIMSISDAIP